MSTEFYRKAIFYESLPLLSSWANHIDVNLESLTVNSQVDVTHENFHEYFLFRQLLASLPSFYLGVYEVSLNPSRRLVLSREDSDSGITGRLDVNRYVQQRSQRRVRGSRRNLPVVRGNHSNDTPENQLILAILLRLRKTLALNPFPIRSSEHLSARHHRSRLFKLSQSEFLNGVCAGSLSRLIPESSARVTRRRTGNESSYGKLIEWVKIWTMVLGPSTDEFDATTQLSFPSGESFWNRVFEVWCLRQCIDSLVRLGFKQIAVNPLHTTSREIAVLKRDATRVDVRFQKSASSESGTWSYENASSLRGIPDISLVSPGKPSLYVDAKFRESSPNKRRSEEVYKMLGYAENFNRGIPNYPFHGLLIFPTRSPHRYRLSRGNTGFIDVLSTTTARNNLNPMIDFAIKDWLE